MKRANIKIPDLMLLPISLLKTNLNFIPYLLLQTIKTNVLKSNQCPVQVQGRKKYIFQHFKSLNPANSSNTVVYVWSSSPKSFVSRGQMMHNLLVSESLLIMCSFFLCVSRWMRPSLVQLAAGLFLRFSRRSASSFTLLVIKFSKICILVSLSAFFALKTLTRT